MTLVSGPLAGQASAMQPPVLTVATYNVQKGIGTDFRRDPHRTARVIATLGADIVALQEADRRFGQRRGVLDTAALAAETGLLPVDVPQRLGGAAHGWHGNILLVRAARIEAVHVLHLPGPDPRGALVADLEMAGLGPLRVIAAHLSLLASARQRQARLLAELATDADRPVIALGDMNEWRRWPSRSLAALDEQLGPPGMAASFPAPFPRLALDRIYAGQGLELLGAAVHDTPLARRSSDHLPVVARVRAATRSADAPPDAAKDG
ncbi:endonuclease/exonuclease/phosphatase family protein [Gemmobacter sp. LW-1]|nr:endonuclease/exonuclease/phosphatase family protein [Gemmobacter sp. LW-1]